MMVRSVQTAGPLPRWFEDFGVIAGKASAMREMEAYLATKHPAQLGFDAALRLACDTWCVGHLALSAESHSDPPTAAQIAEHRKTQLAGASIEAAMMKPSTPVACHVP
jgi:hypothetical protein